MSARPRPKTSRQNPLRKSYGTGEATLLSKLGSRSGHFRHESELPEESKIASMRGGKYPQGSPVRSLDPRPVIRKKRPAPLLPTQSPRHKKNLSAVYRHEEAEHQSDALEIDAFKRSLVALSRGPGISARKKFPEAMSLLYRRDSPRVRPRRYDGASFDARAMVTREQSYDLE